MRRKIAKARPQEGAGLYIRVSLDRTAHGKAEEIVSPETQHDRGQAYCQAQGWVVAMAESDIDESGYRQHYTRRQGLMRLLSGVERGEITKIVVWKFSRLSRRLKEFIEICDLVEAHGAGVVSVSEQVDTSTPAGRLIRNILASFAQFQSEELSEQIYESWITRAKQGRRPPGIAPFGSINDKGLLRPDPDTYQHLVAMFQTFAETHSIRAVWDYLRDHKVEPPRSGTSGWSLNTVKHILTNSAYIGLLDWAGDTFDGRWEPLIAPDLWEKVQAVLAGRRSGPAERRDARMLTGIALCTECGRPMWTHYVRRQQGGKRYLQRTYHCYDPGSRRRGCDIPNLDAEEAEAAVWEAMVQLLQSVDLKALIASSHGQTASTSWDLRNQLLAERRKLQEDTTLLFDLLRSGEITREQFREQNLRLVEELRKVEQALATPGRPVSGPHLEQIRLAADRAAVATNAGERRQLLAELGARVEVTAAGVYLEVLGLRINLRARRLGDTWHFGPEYQRLDYQGWTLTDRQIRFLQRTWSWADRRRLAAKLGRTYKALHSAVSRLRQRGLLGSATNVN